MLCGCCVVSWASGWGIVMGCEPWGMRDGGSGTARSSVLGAMGPRSGSRMRSSTRVSASLRTGLGSRGRKLAMT